MMAMACPPERINFFRVCRVIVDHIPEVLRVVFKDEIKRQHGHTWDDTGQSGAWLVAELTKRSLRGKRKPPIPKQLQLLTSGKREDWDPTLLFLVLLYSNLNLLPTSKHHKAVDRLRELRNNCYGHVSFGTVPAAALNNLFTAVEAAYNDLGISPRWIKSLRAIEKEPILDDATVQYYKKKLLSEFQEQKRRLDENEESIADLKEDVQVLKNQHEQVAKEVNSNKQENAAQIGNLQTKQDDFSQSLQSHATRTAEQFGDIHKKQEELSQGLHNQTTRSAEQIADLHAMQADLKATVSQIAKDQQAQKQQVREQLVTFSRKQEEQSLKQTETDSKLASTQAAVNAINVEVEKHGSQIEELQSQPPVTVNVQVLNITQGVFPKLVPRGGMATDPHPTTLSSAPANYEYSFIEDRSRDQCQFKCYIKYSVDGRKERVDSGGYYATKAAAVEAAEGEIMKKEASKGLHSQGSMPMKKTYKTMLMEYYEMKGMQGVKIIYTKKEQPRRGIQVTVYAPEIGSACGDFCRTKKEAENNAAFHALQQLGEDV